MGSKYTLFPFLLNLEPFPIVKKIIKALFDAKG